MLPKGLQKPAAHKGIDPTPGAPATYTCLPLHYPDSIRSVDSASTRTELFSIFAKRQTTYRAGARDPHLPVVDVCGCAAMRAVGVSALLKWNGAGTVWARLLMSRFLGLESFFLISVS